ncbi:MAG TPA: hypothetical protein VLM80_02605 [Anaerolineales bacterium]|nr:hypothetical protein [Anaerolineales bacterium]
MFKKSRTKFLPVFLAGILALTAITAGIAAAQQFGRSTEGDEVKPEIAPASFDSGLTNNPNVLPPDENSAVKSPNQPAVTFSYYTVSGPELQTRSTGNDQVYSANGCIYLSNGASTGLLTGTGLHLPDGAVIKYIRLYYNDTNNTASVDSYLTRYAPGSATVDLVFTGSTNAYNGGYGFVVSSEITETVNNSAYAYQLYGWPDSAASTLQVCGIRVAYYAPPSSVFGAALPLVVK